MISRTNSTAGRPTSAVNDDARSLAALRNVAASKGPAAAAAPRRFGTALSANTNNAAPKVVPAGKPAMASSLPVHSANNYGAPSDNITPADVVGALDIDMADRYNEMAVTEYVEEIYSNLRKKEAELMPSASYMTIQDDVNEKMRAILIDWLIEVPHLFFSCTF
jgi:cyclin B